MRRLLIRVLLLFFPYREAVRAEVEAAQCLEGSSHKGVRGERKRSLVLNNLCEALPSIPTKDLALVIELVIQER